MPLQFSLKFLSCIDSLTLTDDSHTSFNCSCLSSSCISNCPWNISILLVQYYLTLIYLKIKLLPQLAAFTVLFLFMAYSLIQTVTKSYLSFLWLLSTVFNFSLCSTTTQVQTLINYKLNFAKASLKVSVPVPFLTNCFVLLLRNHHWLPTTLFLQKKKIHTHSLKRYF